MLWNMREFRTGDVVCGLAAKRCTEELGFGDRQIELTPKEEAVLIA